MVKLSFCLDRSDHKYNPGDIINLKIRVEVNSGMTFRSIYARIQGYAHVKWTEYGGVQTPYGPAAVAIPYSSHETFFENYQTLAGAREGPRMRLPAGSHVYHASFQLPRNLPENHENENGHIRYEAKVHMAIPWAFDKTERATFYLNPCVDLNEFPYMNEPISIAAEKTFGFCCCESDPLHSYNVLPRSAYVPGDRIQYSLQLNNDSDVSIDGAIVRLIEKTEYHANSPRSKSLKNTRTLWRHEFSENSRQLVDAMQNTVFSTNLHFDPSWNLRFFNGCSIITVTYYFISEIRTSGCHTNLTNQTLIKMGTIPFRSYETSSPPMAPYLSIVPFPSAPAEPISKQPLASNNDIHSKSIAVISAPEIDWTGMNNLDPPTYIEVELMDKKGKQ